MAAGVLVRVVADDRDVAHRLVRAAVDSDEPGRDLVHGPVQVVDPALERDGELDEVALAPAEQHLLARPQALDAQPDPGGQQERDHCCRRRADRDPGGGRR